jgi:hypothetical protein
MEKNMLQPILQQETLIMYLKLKVNFKKIH